MSDTLARYGWNSRWSERYEAFLASPAGQAVEDPTPGRVLRHDGAGLIVVTEAGNVRAMFGPTLDPAPVVGDWVVLDHRSTPQVTLPRESLLRRRAAGTGEREQGMAANVDLVLAVCGLDRPVRSGRIQRTVTIAVDAGAESLVVLTKADKVEPEAALEAAAAIAEVDPSLDIVTLSARGGWGVDDLLARVGQRTVALIGESGAGKSTLVNALMADDVADEGEVRGGDSKGRHTTTHRELHLLPGGGILIDTPGIREVGVWTDPDAVVESFPDIDELADSCRFRDCAHDREPGCAVRAAVEGGTLDAVRLERWRDLDAEATSAEQRADVIEYKRKARQTGRNARENARADDQLKDR